jgi:hypothetical protein
MFWRWSAESAVFDGVGWLQALWASRSAVCNSLLSACSESSVVVKSLMTWGTRADERTEQTGS